MPTATITRLQPLSPTVTAVPFQEPERKKRRVAAYARVSSDKDEQLNSYEAQVDVFTKRIKENSEWVFVEVYTDEGITATSTKKRNGFNRMVQDALNGKIDLILTKSVSRFARNTVDSLNTIRNLKNHGVEVYFEKENIYTFDTKGEVMLTIMSSLAQDESRNISENVKWGQRKRIADGKVTMAYGRFLGYERGDDGTPRIVEKEAETVRLIYRLFLQGASLNVIAKHLTDSGVPTPGGKKQWHVSTIDSILRNEKYKGDALLQKTYTDDFLTKKKIINNGEVPQFYVENSHPAIIEPEVFDAVREEISKRKAQGKQQSGLGCFSSRIICGECGSYYGSKVWHSTSKYRRTIWRCNHKYDGGDKCRTPHIHEDDIKKAFIEAFNALADGEHPAADIMAELDDTTNFYTEKNALCAEIEAAEELIRKCVDENSRVAQDQDDYQCRYDALTARYATLKQRLDSLTTAQKKTHCGAGENRTDT